MPGAVLGTITRTTASTLLLLALPSLAGVVDTQQAQCCASVKPDLPPATYYGATMFREDDDRSRWKPHVAEPEDPPATAKELVQQVDDLEAEYGVMDPALVDSLGGLAAAYRAEKRPQDAVAALRRGIHLARINDGLHTEKQVDLLEQLILAHLEMGDYPAADAQQRYLYRVKSWRKDHSDPSLGEATLRYADWVRGVYLADIDRERFPRLVELHDVYTDAIEDIESIYGEDSPELLPYLQGRAELSYLISVYPGEQEYGFRGEVSSPTDFTLASEALVRFWRMKDPVYNFRGGLKALRQKEAILRKVEPYNSKDVANALLAIGDWYQWHRRYAEAIKVYREAWALMDEQEGGEMWQRSRLSAPLELPKDTIFNPGLVPLDTPNRAEVSLRFDVNRHGEAKDIEILTPKTEDTRAAVTRAYHYLKNVRFRPRVSEGKVVRTEGVERTYQIRY